MFYFIRIKDSVLQVRFDLSKYWWVFLIVLILLIALVEHFFDYKDTIKSLHKVIADLRVKNQDLNKTNAELQCENKRLKELSKNRKMNSTPERPEFIAKDNPYFTDDLRQNYLRSFETARLDRALSDDATVPKKIELSAVMPSFTTTGAEYKTTLEECSCTDKATRHNPCKHMISLALFVGATYDMNKDVEDLMRQYVEQRSEQSAQARRSKRVGKTNNKGK